MSREVESRRETSQWCEEVGDGGQVGNKENVENQCKVRDESGIGNENNVRNKDEKKEISVSRSWLVGDMGK